MGLYGTRKTICIDAFLNITKKQKGITGNRAVYVAERLWVQFPLRKKPERNQQSDLRLYQTHFKATSTCINAIL